MRTLVKVRPIDQLHYETLYHDPAKDLWTLVKTERMPHNKKRPLATCFSRETQELSEKEVKAWGKKHKLAIAPTKQD